MKEGLNMENLYKYVLQQAKDAYTGTGVHQFDDVATLNIEVGKLIAYKDILHKMEYLGFKPHVDVSPP
jgi:hypothetical protein